MLSFKTFATVATLAFGAISAFAAPVAETSVIARDGQVAGVAKIISDVTIQVTPLVAELKFIQPSNCTVEVLTPIVNDIKGVVNGAISEVNQLVGQPVNVILATVDGTAQITVNELASLVATLLNLVFSALGAVLNVAGGALNVVLPLLASVGEVVGSLLSAVLSLVGGLLGGLVPAILALVGDILSVVTSLQINVLVKVLGISA